MPRPGHCPSICRGPSGQKGAGYWADIEDLVNIGAYAAGTTVEFDLAVQMKAGDRTPCFSRPIEERAPFEESRAQFLALDAEMFRAAGRLEARQRSKRGTAAVGGAGLQPASAR